MEIGNLNIKLRLLKDFKVEGGLTPQKIRKKKVMEK